MEWIFAGKSDYFSPFTMQAVLVKTLNGDNLLSSPEFDYHSYAPVVALCPTGRSHD